MRGHRRRHRAGVHDRRTKEKEVAHRVGARPARRQRRGLPAAPRRPGPRRLRDHGDAAAARHRPHSLVRGVYATLRADRPPAGRHRDGKLIADPVRSREAGAHRPADGAARGDRGANRRVQRRPRRSAETARWPTPPAGRSGLARAVWVSREGGVDAGGLRPGIRRVSSSRRRCRRTARRWPSACIARRGAGHLGQAAPDGPVLPDHLRRHHPACGRPGRPTGATSATSSTASGRGAGPRTLTGPTAPAPRGSAPLARWSSGRWSLSRRPLAAAPARRDRGRATATSRRSGPGDTTLVPLVATAARGDCPGALARRPLAGVRLERIGTSPRSTSGRSPRPRRPSGRSPPRAAPSRPGRAPGASCSTSTAKGEMVSAEIPAGGYLRWAGSGSSSRPRSSGGGPVPSYSLSPDNKRFLVLREGEAGQPGELVVAENWQQQLKAQAGR